MAKRDNKTGDLLSWKPPPVAVDYEENVAGQGELEHQISRLISRALGDARDKLKLQRAEVARQMSEVLCRRVTEDNLNKWCSEANEHHRIPLDAFVALIKVTRAEELTAFVPKQFGFVVVPEEYTDIVRLHQLQEHEARIAAEKSMLTLRLRSSR